MPTHKDVVITVKDGLSLAQLVAPQPKSSQGSGTQNGAQINKRRTDFEAERAAFEKKIFAEWTQDAINTYENGKLDAEIAYFTTAKAKDASTPAVKPTPAPTPTPAPVAQPVRATTPTPVSVKPSAPSPQPVKATPAKDDNAEVIRVTRAIMNKVFVTLKSKFDADQTYNTAFILEATRDTIVSTTSENENDPNIATLRKILNQVYQDFKQKFDPELTYGATAILDEVKATIVSTTNNLTNTAPMESAPQESKPASFKPAPKVVETKPVFTPKPFVSQANKKPEIREEPAPAFIKPTQTAEVISSKSPVNERTMSKPAPKSDTTDGEATKLSTAKIRDEAAKRINNEPRSGQVDLRDPAVLSTYVRMRDNNDPLNWIIFGYDIKNKDKLLVAETGEGDFDEFYEAIPEDKPVYMFLNYKFGDTGRNKSVFMSYVPDSLNGLTKAKVVGHRGDIEKFIKYMHISWHCLSYDEIKEADLKKMLLNAGGANYSVQEDNKGDFSNYKNTTKSFYSEKDKETQVKAVYHTGPLSVTPCDISGRAMVASQTEFKSNTSNFFKGER